VGSWSEATFLLLLVSVPSRLTDSVFSGMLKLHTKMGTKLMNSTFSAFSEMILSELTMARLNYANVLTHFSHSGVDEMADNTWYAG
jgi:hypothetical protein